MQDPRFKNVSPSARSLGEYFYKYSEQIFEGAKAVSSESLNQAFDLIEQAVTSGKRIWVCGNGGSASIAGHMCCDWTKGTYAAGQPSIRVHSMSCNTPLLTAISNDMGYEKSFSMQLEMLADAGDLLILISSSGNSPNILQAVEVARSKKIKTIGLVGFDGGKLLKLCNAAIHVPVNNYGIIEDTHQMFMHSVAQFIANKRDGKG